MENPYQLFKFRPVDKRFVDSLVKSTLYFSTSAGLNDPFDCNVDIAKSILNAARALSGEQATKLEALAKNTTLYEKLQNDISKLGICSFGGELLNTLMWSHYGCDHKGVAVTYEFSEEFILDPENRIFGISGMSYEKDSLTNWFISIADKLPIDFDEFVPELAKRILTSKSPAWHYEREVRIIRLDRGSFKIPKSCIKQICFGLRTSAGDVELVREIVKGFGHDVTFCKVVRGDSDFGITAEEL